MLGHEEWWVMRSLFRKSLERNGLDERRMDFQQSEVFGVA